MQDREGVITARLRLRDKDGRTWKRADDYQDRDTSGPGWLAIVSERSQVSFPFHAALDLYGFDGPEGKYFVVEEGTYP